jgi:ParB family transcriptional regulator, chromosome partitioning protein
MEIDVSQIIPNPEQMRADFDEKSLAVMSKSIRKHGLLNPIAVYQEGDHYVLIDGERRLRAAKLAGLKKIEANILPDKEYKNDSMLEMSVIGNVQRKNMNPVEEGQAYAKMLKAGKSRSEVSRMFGVSRAWIGTLVAITELDPEIQELYRQRSLPVDIVAIKAINKIPVRERVKIAEGFAKQNLGTVTILNQCKRISNNREEIKEPPAPNQDAPAYLYHKKDKGFIDVDHWNALHQSGHVPPWYLFAPTIRKTCENCTLYSVASFTNCRDCPMVEFIGLLKDAMKSDMEIK